MERSDRLGQEYTGTVPCFAFVRDVLAERGLVLPEFAYGSAEHAEALLRHLAEYGEKVDEPRDGDVVLFNSKGQAAHIGVMCGPEEFVHHDERNGVSRERTTAFHWRSRIAGYYRPRIPEPVA